MFRVPLKRTQPVRLLSKGPCCIEAKTASTQFYGRLVLVGTVTFLQSSLSLSPMYVPRPTACSPASQLYGYLPYLVSR